MFVSPELARNGRDHLVLHTDRPTKVFACIPIYSLVTIARPGYVRMKLASGLRGVVPAAMWAIANYKPINIFCQRVG